MTDQPPTQPTPILEARALEALLALAGALYYALDDSEEDRDGSHIIDKDNALKLCAALDVLDELPDDQPGYTMGPAAKAGWALRRLRADLALQIQGEKPPHFDFTEDGRMFALPTWERSNEATSAQLIMCSIDVADETIAGWSDDQMKAADVWACSVHLRASDNDDVVIPPKPDFLPPEKPWEATVPGTII